MKKIGIGIDFGTTNSLASVWGSDVIRVLGRQQETRRPVVFWHKDANAGNRPHASVVWFKPDDSVVVGFEARRNMQELSGTLGHSFSRSVKRSLESKGDILTHGGRRFEPFEIAAHIFSHLKKDAEVHPTLHGHKFEECVVTVPVGFSGSQRRQIRRAMERAGLVLQGFIHEPFAAMVAHFYHPERKLAALRGKRVMVFDWGGGTLDVCLAEGSLDGSTLYELAHDGIADHAGDDFDRRLMGNLRGRFLERHPMLTSDDIDTRCRAQDRFWINAELGKIELSTEESVRVRVPNFLDGEVPLDLGETVKRTDFEEMIDSEVKAAAACTLRCLEKARLGASSIDYVLMVGGTSLIPKVRRQLEEIFGAKVQITFEPDAAIARGAAIVAAEEWKPVNAVTLGCEMARGEFFSFLDRGRPLVASSSQKFIFYCTDPRDGVANFIFCKKPVSGDNVVVPIGAILQVPVSTERPAAYRDLDRMLVRSIVTADATLMIDVQHTGTNHSFQHEISDVSFGLQLL
ncbi:MAG: Hsp70 family protein [Blastocatellia bacterium]|nr:Hsp70 family protein [Blastocatellia bacterium]